LLVAVISAAVVMMVVLVRAISLILLLLLLRMSTFVLIVGHVALISVVSNDVKSFTFVIRSTCGFLLRNILSNSSLAMLETFRSARLTLITIENELMRLNCLSSAG